jgi:aminopeptidase
MTNPRIRNLAKILVDYSIKIKKGDTIKISFGIEALELAKECYKLILKKGAFPIANIQAPGFAFSYYSLATDEMLKKHPKIAEFEAKHTDGIISIGTEYNTKEFSNIDPKKIALRSKVIRPISDIYLEKDNWVGLEFPTNALAQEAEMSLEEIEDFVYKATILDWKKESKKQDRLKKILDKGKDVRIISNDTDITFSIKGRQGIKCDGHRNMPDGEVFIAPVEDTVNGFIRYTYPAIYNGKEVEDVYLEFKDGKVIRAKAKKNEDFLHAMINTDKGSKYLGEFGIGVNYGIKKFIKNILFDEKIGGTIHLALGMAYKEGGGKNDSALHWDMIKDLRKGGEIQIDGKSIQKNGKFLFTL